MTSKPTARRWAEMRRAEFVDALASNPVVVVPVGSIEQHGPHCPVDVDVSIPTFIADQASTLVRDFPLIVAPTVPFGFTHYNQGFPGTITLQLETFISLVSEVCAGIHRNGFHRIILLNGHGGNHHPIRAIATKLAEQNVYVIAISHWDLMTEEMIAWGDADNGIGHAGEWETSLQLYLRPHLVDRSVEVAEDWEPSVDPAFASFARFAERRRETPNGVMGDPTVATAEKGQRYVDLASQRLADLASAFHRHPVRDYFHADRSGSA